MLRCHPLYQPGRISKHVNRGRSKYLLSSVLCCRHDTRHWKDRGGEGIVPEVTAQWDTFACFLHALQWPQNPFFYFLKLYWIIVDLQAKTTFFKKISPLHKQYFANNLKLIWKKVFKSHRNLYNHGENTWTFTYFS